jgi:hypothetical protein
MGEWRTENEEKEEPIGELLHGESVTPYCGRGEWRMGITRESTLPMKHNSA